MRLARNHTARLLLLAFCASLMALAVRPGAAAVGPSGVRIRFPDRPARGYMSYGSIAEPEVYVPLAADLSRYGVKVRLHGDTVALYRQGERIAEWVKVTSPLDVPETGEPIVGIATGGQIFLPLTRVAELLQLKVTPNEKQNLVVLEPAPRPGGRPGPRPVILTPDNAPRLSSVKIKTDGQALMLEIAATGPVSIAQFRLRNPDRLVFDIVDAVWAKDATVPTTAPNLKAIRTGQFQDTIARLVLETTDAKLVCVELTAGPSRTLKARLARGKEVKGVTGAQLQAALRRRSRQLASRSGFTRPADFRSAIAALAANLLPIPPPSGNLNGKVICVDPGHGGKSSGAIGKDGYMEKEPCLAISLQLRRALLEAGAQVIMTREDDSYASLSDRYDLANAQRVDLFISIHCNSNPKRNSRRGTETYYWTPRSELLARAVHPEVVKSVAQRDGGVRGNRRFAVIRHTTMPSILVEVAYLNHDGDRALLKSPAFHVKVGAAIRDGVLRYYAALAR